MRIARSLPFVLAFLAIPVVLQFAAPPAPDYTHYQERWFTPPKRPHPLLAHKQYHSAAMNVDVGYSIYLPPGYDAPENKDSRYPVIYWCHGLNGSEGGDANATNTIDNAIKARQVPPVILVFVSGGSRAFYSDSPDGKLLSATTITKELIPHVDQTYRTVAARQGRAIQGMSMGGWGALKLALQNPEMFSSVVAFAPSLRTAQSLEGSHPDVYKRMFGGEAKNFESQHPLTLLKSRGADLRGKLPLAVFIGDADYLLDGNRKMHALLGELKYEHVYEEFPGIDHNLGKLIAVVKQRGFEFAAKAFGNPPPGGPALPR